MFCVECGADNEAEAAFCRMCGTPLSQPAPVIVNQSGEQLGQGAVPPAYGQPQPGAQQPYPQNGGMPPAAQPPRPQAEGVLGAAWKDITSTPGWFKKVLILCLIGLVPILNFAVIGYALRWARELSFGQRTSMPQEIFRKKEISTGFSAWLVSFALECVALMLIMLAGLVIGAVFGIINIGVGVIIGTVIVVALAIASVVLWEPFVRGSVMRMTVVGYLESGFNVKKVLAAYRKSMGSLIGASLVPDIIVGLISGVLQGILYGIMFGIASVSATGISSRGRAAVNFAMNDPNTAIQIVYALGLGIVLLMVIFTIVMAMLSTFAMLFSYRAVGHWAARNAAEWTNEADDMSVDTAETVTSRGDGPINTPGSTAPGGQYPA